MLDNILFFAFGAMICWGIGDFLMQRSIWKMGNIETLAYIGAIGSVALLPFVLGEISAVFSPQNTYLLLALAFFTLLSSVLNFHAFKIGKLSVVEVMLEFELPVSVLLGVIFFSETLSLAQIILISVVFCGIVLIALEKLSLKHILGNFEKGAIFALAGGMAMGVMNFFTAAGAKQISPIIAIWFPWTALAIFCIIYIFAKGSGRKFLKNIQQNKELVIATAFVDTFAWVLFAFALQSNELSVTTAITESYPVIGVLLGLRFNREKIVKHQWLGVIIAIVGSIWLAIL